MVNGCQAWLLKHSEWFRQRAIEKWAHDRGWQFKKVHKPGGLIILAEWGNVPWRLEWGPSQRDYIHGYELRFRVPLNLPQDFNFLLMNRALYLYLEQQAFDKLTQSTQTVIDASLPEEVRWLSLLEKINWPELKSVSTRISVVGSQPSLAPVWLSPEVLRQLDQFCQQHLKPSVPWLAMTLRGRLYFRIAMPQADLTQIRELSDWVETAALRLQSWAQSSNPETGPASLRSEFASSSHVTPPARKLAIHD
jgi:hypothetical protein